MVDCSVWVSTMNFSNITTDGREEFRILCHTFPELYKEKSESKIITQEERKISLWQQTEYSYKLVNANPIYK